MIYRQNYITSQHNINLQHSKKIYDQLHRKDLRTFIIRKSQLQHLRTSSQISKTPTGLNQKYMKSHSETKNNQINKSENFGILNKIIASSKRKYTPPKPIFRKDNKSNKNITKQLTLLESEEKEKKQTYRPTSRTFKSQSPKIDRKIVRKKETQTSIGGMEDKIHFTEFESYLGFINSDEKFFKINLNFDSLRRMGARQAWKQLDIRNAQLIEGMMKHLIENIMDPNEENLESIKDICRIYFNNFEKVKMQLILKQHYFKLFAFRLKPVFIIQRISLYFGYILAQKRILETKSMIGYRKIMEHLCQIYNLIVKIICNVQQNKKGKEINEAFKILKSVGQVEKNIENIEYELQKMVSEIRLKQFVHIYKVLKPFFSANYPYQLLTKTQMILSWRYLKVPPTPFLPALTPNLTYTLAIDLDETLIYFNQTTHILKYRPGLDIFFKQLRHRYEIVIFTASSKLYADTIIKEIQEYGRIFTYRLYKEHLTLCNGRLIKDIKRLGRDLKKTIIIDDLAVNFGNCRENGIQVSSWTGEKQDKKLLQILPVLKNIVDHQVDDVRVQIKKKKESLSYLSQMKEQIDNFILSV